MADDIQALAAVQPLKDEWAEVFYGLPAKQQRQQLEDFLIRARQLVQRYPQAAEPLLMEALVLCAQAGSDGGLGALSKVRDAREVLQRAIGLDPLAMEGSAYVMLGNLYYRLPGWPLSFGDDHLARQYLETALRHFPNELDTNYFYGDFLLDQGQFEQALIYLEKAENAPVRPDSRLSDLKLKQELKPALKDAREKNTARASFFSRFLSSLKNR
jgi:tetratricopeptide (TPR) repeat protein